MWEIVLITVMVLTALTLIIAGFMRAFKGEKNPCGGSCSCKGGQCMGPSDGGARENSHTQESKA